MQKSQSGLLTRDPRYSFPKQARFPAIRVEGVPKFYDKNVPRPRYTSFGYGKKY